jgi:hypothetical protein
VAGQTLRRWRRQRPIPKRQRRPKRAAAGDDLESTGCACVQCGSGASSFFQPRGLAFSRPSRAGAVEFAASMAGKGCFSDRTPPRGRRGRRGERSGQADCVQAHSRRRVNARVTCALGVGRTMGPKRSAMSSQGHLADLVSSTMRAVAIPLRAPGPPPSLSARLIDGRRWLQRASCSTQQSREGTGRRGGRRGAAAVGSGGSDQQRRNSMQLQSVDLIARRLTGTVETPSQPSGRSLAANTPVQTLPGGWRAVPAFLAPSSPWHVWFYSAQGVPVPVHASRGWG